jgi:hypothetical protein
MPHIKERDPIRRPATHHGLPGDVAQHPATKAVGPAATARSDRGVDRPLSSKTHHFSVPAPVPAGAVRLQRGWVPVAVPEEG